MIIEQLISKRTNGSFIIYMPVAGYDSSNRHYKVPEFSHLHNGTFACLTFLFPNLHQMHHSFHCFIHILNADEFQFGMNGLFAGK